MSIVILCGIYLAELACYQLGIRILFEARQKTKLWMMIGILFPVVIGCLPVDVSGKNALITGSIILIIFFSFEGRGVEKGIKILLTLLLLACIDDIFMRPCKMILTSDYNNYLINLNYLIVKICTATSVVLLNLIKTKNKQKFKAHINSIIYFVIGIITACMMFCLAILNQVIKYLPNNSFVIICNILNAAILVSIFLLVVFVIYIKNTHERMELLLKTEKLLKESQVNYYKQALKKETDTRKYRHDMANHLGYIRDILAENKIDDAKKYLSGILGGFNKLLNVYRITGNDMIDTIMNHLFSVLPEDVEIVIENRTPVEFKIDDTEVCTIFSNIFQNIVEEIIENEINSAKINISIRKGREFVEYTIKNSLSELIDERYIGKNGLPKSHKSDKENHGIGMLNVKETVERNQGNFEWYQDKDYFCVIIILPIR